MPLTSTDPIELVPATPTEDADYASPPAYRRRIQVLTLHDGDVVPARLFESAGLRRMSAEGRLDAAVAEVRDWGADRVAHHLASALGLEGHHRVRVARAVVDFNRFPGVTRPGTPHLERLALGGPVCDALDDVHRRAVLAQWYDGISQRMEELIRGRLMILSVHTYDERNATHTQRPEVSLLSRSDSYQQHSRLPHGLFDPLFPDVLVESSAKRVLRDRMGLTLEKGGVSIEHNYPYCLPDGSLEIRSQPWFFFHALRQRFEVERPETREAPGFRTVWEMLFNTNLRRADASALSRYLHRYCEAPAGAEAEFAAAAAAYEHIAAHLQSRPEFVSAYRRSAERTSAITIEVRKDLVWNFRDGEPVGPNDANAQRIGRLLARGIARYLQHDRPGASDVV